jgi:hypothetical protein
MSRVTTISVLLLAVVTSAGCGDDDTPPTTPTPPTEITETFEGSLTPFSARIHNFAVGNSGQVSATLTAITPADTTVGLDLGTWSGTFCQVSVARPETKQGDSVPGTATTVAQLCVRIYDVSPNGLPADVPYTITVTHF